MRAFSGFVTAKRSYVLWTTGAIPRDIGWFSGPWALRLGYQCGLTREELEALADGPWVVKQGPGGQVILQVC